MRYCSIALLLFAACAERNAILRDVPPGATVAFDHKEVRVADDKGVLQHEHKVGFNEVLVEVDDGKGIDSYVLPRERMDCVYGALGCMASVVVSSLCSCAAFQAVHERGALQSAELLAPGLILQNSIQAVAHPTASSLVAASIAGGIGLMPAILMLPLLPSADVSLTKLSPPGEEVQF